MMPGFLTERTCNGFLDHLFGGVKSELRAKLYVGMFLLRAMWGGYVVEPTAPSYARVELENNLDLFADAYLGTKINSKPIVFPYAHEPWGDVVSIFISDSKVGGTVIAMADLPQARSIWVDFYHPPTIPIGSLYLSMR